MTDLFYRHGGTFTGKPSLDEKNRPYIVQPRVCGRCGGAGGSEKWRYTGWTCYQCGGARFDGTVTHKLYTTEQLEKLNATAMKRAAKKAATAEAKRIENQKVADARRASFMEQYGKLLDRAAQYAERSEFIKDVLGKALARAELSEGQEIALRDVLDKIEASNLKKAASQYVGTIGERVVLTVTAERVNSFESQFGIMQITSMRDQAGNAVVSKGRYIPPTAQWDREAEKWVINPEPFTIKATIKGHDRYRDECQTIVQRVVDVEQKAT